MRSRACVSVNSIWMGLAVIACGPAEIRSTDPSGAAFESRVQENLSQVDQYEVGTATYEQFRRYPWPSFTVLHMDVRSGPVKSADAVVVLGIAGGEATSSGGAEGDVDAVLGQIDARGFCIVRGWFEGQRHVATLPMECPAVIRDELDGILHDFDNLTGGDAIWVLRFEEGLLLSKQRL
jgi:hypothetical protein